MKQKTIVVIAVLCNIAFIFAGCKHTSTTAENSIVFDSVRVEKTYHLFNDTTKPACAISVGFTYPKEYKNEKALKSMQHIFTSMLLGENSEAASIPQAIDAYVNNYIDEYKEMETDYDDALGVSAYSFDEIAGTSIEFNKGNILSFVTNIWNYTGGAHGNGNIQGRVIDITSGNLVSRADIFTDGFNNELSRLIVQALMAEYDVQTPEDLLGVGFFDITEIAPNDNFIANDKGITFIYNTYEIAPYVMGPIQVFLPYDGICSYMKKDSPLAKFIK